MSSVKLKFLQMYEEIELSEVLTKGLETTKLDQSKKDHIIQFLHCLVPHEKPGEILVDVRNLAINTTTSGKCSK